MTLWDGQTHFVEILGIHIGLFSGYVGLFSRFIRHLVICQHMFVCHVRVSSSCVICQHMFVCICQHVFVCYMSTCVRHSFANICRARFFEYLALVVTLGDGQTHLSDENLLMYIVMSHMRMSHVTYEKESCRIWEWVMSHMRMSHVTYEKESCRIWEWIMSHMRMSHVTYENESCHLWERVMSHMRMSDVTYEHESCHISDENLLMYICKFTHVYAYLHTHIYV